MTVQTLTLYILAYLLVSLTPGPAVIFVTSQSVWRGRSAGIKAAFGIETANAIFWVLTSFGLAAAIATSQMLFMTVKWFGVVYLAWLGVKAIRGSFKPAAATAQETTGANNAWRDGVIVGLSNPKAVLFFVALVPQFIDPAQAALPQIAILAITGVTIDLSIIVIYALAAGELRRVMTRTRVRRWFERSVGGAFLSLALAAALYRRA